MNSMKSRTRQTNQFGVVAVETYNIAVLSQHATLSTSVQTGQCIEAGLLFHKYTPGFATLPKAR